MRPIASLKLHCAGAITHPWFGKQRTLSHPTLPTSKTPHGLKVEGGKGGWELGAAMMRWQVRAASLQAWAADRIPARIASAGAA